MMRFLIKVPKILKRISVYFLKNFRISLFIYNSFFKIINKKRFYSSINQRVSLSIFDYQELSKPLPYCPIEPVKDSNYYGHYHCIKKYANIDRIEHSVEHGLYLGNYVPRASYLNTVKSIITFSNNRRKHLIESNINKPIVTIGPYIHYASPLLNENDFDELKNELGSTFLLFPSHSVKSGTVKIDAEHLIDKVKKISSGFKTVIVCFFYQDIIHNVYPKYFIDAGFKIVTAGHRYDLNFISRLKSIIMLADYTASNSIGTHIGYCIYLNKPHYLIENETYRYYNDTLAEQYRNEEQIKSLEEEKEEIRKVFSFYSDQITEEQKNVIDKYWGTSLIKGPEELKNLLRASAISPLGNL